MVYLVTWYKSLKETYHYPFKSKERAINFKNNLKTAYPESNIQLKELQFED